MISPTFLPLFAIAALDTFLSIPFYSFDMIDDALKKALLKARQY